MMMAQEIIDAYAAVHPGGVEYWTVITMNEDGEQHAYVMPTVTFQNLAVEYGLDENDIDALLRIALLQFHAPDPWHRPDVESDPAAQKGYVRGGLPVRLDNAASTREAREAHLERIAWTEANVVQFVEPEPSQRRATQALARAADRGAAEEVVDPYERLTALKASYRPDYMQMVETRTHLSRVLGREV